MYTPRNLNWSTTSSGNVRWGGLQLGGRVIITLVLSRFSFIELLLDHCKPQSMVAYNFESQDVDNGLEYMMSSAYIVMSASGV